MRYLTYFTSDRHRIDISSWPWKGRIYYDGELVSCRRSFWGSRHEFSVQEHSERCSYLIDIFYRWPLRVGFDIYRNGKALLLS